MSMEQQFDSLGQLPTPPGTVLPSGFPGAELFGTLAQQLGLSSMGVYTPWAARESGVEWELVRQPPDTNVMAFPITDAVLSAMTSLTFGQPVPFVAVITEALPAPDQINQAFSGSPYAFYQTQAVYRQDDNGSPPLIYFVHWGEYRQPGDPQFGKGSTDSAASALSGSLVYAVQVNYDTTARRQPPATGFVDALNQQFGSPGESPLPPPPPPPPGEEPPPGEPPPPGEEPKKASMMVPAAVGLGVAVGSFFLVRHLRSR